ncbi:MAG: hypothetical protein K2Q25_07765 [Mycobacteriaceae bacterium]|nr:hypothetical protein [Mycobacteriaceae bacterium]
MRRDFAGLIATILFVAFVMHFLWWLIDAALWAGAAYLLYRWFRARRQQRALLAAQADEQNARWLAGDERAAFGEYQPVTLPSVGCSPAAVAAQGSTDWSRIVRPLFVETGKAPTVSESGTWVSGSCSTKPSGLPR